MDNRPIGVFDSGLGGLTVVKELQQVLPEEDIVYFGDTGRVPYGTRSRETIIRYALQDIAFLRSQNVKMIIAACGTVSAALPQDMVNGFDFYYSSVLLPAAQAACAQSKTGKIGVIATQASIKSGAYGKAMRTIRPDATVIGNACPLFVPLVENGFIERENPVTRMVAEQYLKPFINNVDTLILGCTHFPILREIIADILGGDIALINPGTETARQTRALLTEQNMLHEKGSGGNYCYYVSDNMESFSAIGSICLGKEISGDVQFVSVDGLAV